MIKEANVTVKVKDIDISVSFYESLGLKLKNRWGNHYAQLTGPGITIGLHPTNDSIRQNGSGNVSIGFTTDKFDEAKARLQKLSINFSERKEEGGQFLHFKDPDNTELYFIKPKW